MTVDGTEIHTEEQAKEYLEGIRWGGEERKCPKCDDQELSQTVHKEMDYWCKSCRKYFTVRTGTKLHKTEIPFMVLIDAAIRVTEANPQKPFFLDTQALGGSNVSKFMAESIYKKFYEADALASGLTVRERLERLLLDK